MKATYESIITSYQVDVPQHLDPQDYVPVAERFVAQGDVYARLEPNLKPEGTGSPCHHIKVVAGDADRNSHILHCPNGRWHPGSYRHQVADYGLVLIPEGSVGYLTHTGEHGATGLAPGTWRLWGQCEMSNGEIRRVID